MPDHAPAPGRRRFLASLALASAATPLLASCAATPHPRGPAPPAPHPPESERGAEAGALAGVRGYPLPPDAAPAFTFSALRSGDPAPRPGAPRHRPAG